MIARATSLFTFLRGEPFGDRSREAPSLVGGYGVAATRGVGASAPAALPRTALLQSARWDCLPRTVGRGRRMLSMTARIVRYFFMVVLGMLGGGLVLWVEQPAAQSCVLHWWLSS